jgi:hypothetical protein
MAQHNGKRARATSWPRKVSRQHAAGALRYAIRQARASQVSAAGWMHRSERTVREWLAERVPVELESVLCSGRLRRPFLRYLSVCDRRVRNGRPA